MIDEGVKAQMCVTSPPYWWLRDYGTGAWEGGEAGCDHDVRGWDGPKQTQGAMSGHAAKADRLDRGTCAKCGARRVDRQIGLEGTPEEYVATMVEVFRLVRKVMDDSATLWLNIGDTIVRKQLQGIPWRVALALQKDGWYLRSDIIWHKPNAMPESITDRPTRAHEYLFLFSKSSRYYYDQEAIREPCIYGDHPRNGVPDRLPIQAPGQPAQSGFTRIRRSGNKERKFRVDHGGNPDLANARQGFGVPWEDTNGRRNKRSVWTIASEPCPDLHYASFPRKLVEPCILAGSRPGDIVLDPFLGSGTTAQVAQHLGRGWFGIDLNQEYMPMQQRRTAQTAMALASPNYSAS